MSSFVDRSDEPCKHKSAEINTKDRERTLTARKDDDTNKINRLHAVSYQSSSVNEIVSYAESAVSAFEEDLRRPLYTNIEESNLILTYIPAKNSIQKYIFIFHRLSFICWMKKTC